jgi:hypothetical protein
MPETIPSLWPPEFKIDVQTPYTILRVQAELLGKLTRGILEGVVETETSEDRVQHRLVVIAPAYNGYRLTLVVVLHNANLPYPAEVRAEALLRVQERLSPPRPVRPGNSRDTEYPLANSDEEMQTLVSKALQSDQSKAAILSLIAKSNEARRSPSPVSQARPGDPNGANE